MMVGMEELEDVLENIIVCLLLRRSLLLLFTVTFSLLKKITNIYPSKCKK